MTAIFNNSATTGSMDIKHEMIYREDDVLLVKTEPQLHSPCQPASGNGITVTNLLSSSNLCATTNGLATTLAGGSALSTVNGLAVATSNNGLGAGGPFSGFTATSVAVTPNKRPRTDDWLSSPSSGTISVSAPPLTPSPGPPSQPYTVISNGYSSPMSSGSYDPYSPNGKIVKVFEKNGGFKMKSRRASLVGMIDVTNLPATGRRPLIPPRAAPVSADSYDLLAGVGRNGNLGHMRARPRSQQDTQGILQYVEMENQGNGLTFTATRYQRSGVTDVNGTGAGIPQKKLNKEER
ncbi:hypothetical protein NQ315_010020 [Exocentrus adspersus]|uniref:Uncharacterized protein n=1 Tax=Exocentrus adspersus TaxID=1586481 RepID=A0AAV8VL06_9CUCU|nr:hypothetical protein NQ315_010020 [Exocentrus adspersus]